MTTAQVRRTALYQGQRARGQPLQYPGVIAVRVGNGNDDTLASFQSHRTDSSGTTVLAVPVAFTDALTAPSKASRAAPVHGIMFVPLLDGDALGVVLDEVELWDLTATPGVVVDVDLETHHWNCPGSSIGALLSPWPPHS